MSRFCTFSIRKPELNLIMAKTEARGVILGHWRKSDVVDESKKHAVVGFLTSRGDLRMLLQPFTTEGESLAQEYPLPYGPYARQIGFSDIVFCSHLKNLHPPQVKEYIRIRSNSNIEAKEERDAANMAAVEAVIRQVNQNQPCGDPLQPHRHASANKSLVDFSTSIQSASSQSPSELIPSSHKSNTADQKPFHTRAPSHSDKSCTHSVEAAQIKDASKVSRDFPSRAGQVRIKTHGNHVESEVSENMSVPAEYGPTQGRTNLWSSKNTQRLFKRRKIALAEDSFGDVIKYERKQTGPFSGRLVSQGVIVDVDGDDYIEYRVLATVSLF